MKAKAAAVAAPYRSSSAQRSVGTRSWPRAAAKVSSDAAAPTATQAPMVIESVRESRRSPARRYTAKETAADREKAIPVEVICTWPLPAAITADPPAANARAATSERAGRRRVMTRSATVTTAGYE